MYNRFLNIDLKNNKRGGQKSFMYVTFSKIVKLLNPLF